MIEDLNYFNHKLVITSIDVGNEVTNLVVDETTIKFNVRFSDKHKSKILSNLLNKDLIKPKVTMN